jgi:membrane-associated phospholipid phosphatase
MKWKFANFDWKEFSRENQWFLLAFGAFAAIGLLWVGGAPKGALVLYFSAHRSTAGDVFFRFWTHAGEAAGFFFVLGYLLFRHRHRVLALPVLTLGVALLANATKRLFRQPRPARYFEELGVLEQLRPVAGVPLLKGLSSLPSGHTMAAFAFFSFLAFCIPQKRWPALLLFLAAMLVGLSRIYLGQHFEEDVLLGSVLGLLLSAVLFRYSHVETKAG